MQLWLVLLGSALALTVIATCVRWGVELDLRAQGEPTGAWAIALGVALGPIAVTSLWARSVPFRVDVFCFGRPLELGRGRRSDTAAAEPDPPASSGPEAAEQHQREARPAPSLTERLREGERYLSLAGRLEPLVRVDAIELDCSYGFRDVALTGRFVAVLSVLGALLPRRVSLRQTPLWHGPERWSVQAQGRVGVAFGLVLVELLRYIVARRFGNTRSRSVAPAGASPLPPI